MEDSLGDQPRGGDDDERMIAPEGTFVREILAHDQAPGTTSLNQSQHQQRRGSSASLPGGQTSVNAPGRADGDDDDLFHARSEAIAQSFEAAQKRVSLFKPPSRSPSVAQSDVSGARTKNQIVLEQLRHSEEARAAARSMRTGVTEGSGGDGFSDRGSDGTNPEDVLWGEHYTYNLVDSSCFCLAADSPTRRNLFFMIDHAYFERAVLTVIVLSMGAMVLDTPAIREHDPVLDIVFALEIVFQVLFTLEMLVKMLALGIVMHKYSYLRSPWNVCDALIVIFGFCAFALSSQFRTLRLLRVFRLLRAMGRVKQLHSISIALSNSAARMGDVALLMIFVTMTMAVLGLQLFVESFQRRCYFYIEQPFPVYFENGTLDPAATAANNLTRVVPTLDPLDSSLCGVSGHQCERGAVCATHRDVYEDPYLNFDNIGNAVFYVLKIITMDNWPGDNVKMQQTEGFFYFIYAFVVVIFGSFFCLNLILAILSGEYETVVKEQAEGGASDAGDDDRPGAADGLIVTGPDAMEEDEDELQDLDSEDADVISRRNNDGGEFVSGGAEYDATRASTTGANKSVLRMLRDAVKTLITNPWFARVILTVTVINVIALACDHHLIDETFDEVLDNINLTCSIIFIIEATLKIFALLAKYFYDGFNVFDFILCVVSIPEMILSSGGSTFSALRAFRLARVVRVMNNSKTMRQLLMTVVDAAKGSAFLFLFLGMFLLTMSLFAVDFLTTSIPPDMRPNYTTLADALLANFIVLTGENWVEIGVWSIDGSSWLAAIYFYAYYAVGNYLLLNFVIVILITSFNQAADRLRAEEQEELQQLSQLDERVSAVEAQQGEGALVAGGSHAPGANASNESPAEGIRFVDLSEEEQRKRSSQPSLGGGNTASPRSPAETPHGEPSPSSASSKGNKKGKKATISPQVSGQYSLSDGGEQAVRTPRSGSGRADNASMTMTASGGKELEPPVEVDVLDLKHHTLPLEDFISAIRSVVGEPLTDDEIRERMKGNSFCIFSPENKFRFYVAKLVSHPAFEAFVMLVIIESCISLGFENPESRKNPRVDQFLDINSYVLVAIFAIEALLRSIAWGVFWGEGTYLSDNWNKIDFFVLLISVVAIFVHDIKALRSLRIFRLAAKVAAVRTAIAAVIAALPGIGNVALLILFTFIVFGILGVQLFKGKFVECNDDSITYRGNCTGNFTTTSTYFEAFSNGTVVEHTVTETLPRRWVHDYFNFNHLGYAVLTLIQQMFSDGWSNVLYSAMDARSYDYAKQFNASPENAIFFVVFIIVGNFFLINLFVGSLVDSFSHERNVSDGKIDREGNPLLTEEQDGWIRAYRVVSAVSLLPYVSKAENPIRALCQWMYFADDERLSPSLKFEWFITGAIVLNAILMCTTHADQPQWWTDGLWWMNLTFAVLFTIEAIIKICALLPAAYFGDPWNRFDFLMVPIAYISLFLGGPGTNAIRVLRVARVLRLVKRAKGLKRLFDSLLYALPQLGNISLLLLLTLFVFGVIGTALFGELLIDPNSDFPLTEDFNFKNALYSMVLLFQISTTESWPDVMQACMMDESNSGCSKEAGNCGSWLSIPYFVLFMFVANSVALNLFIFVIVDNYMEVNSMNSPENQLLFYRLQAFGVSWSVLDKERKQRLKWEQFLVILRRTMRENPQTPEEFDEAPTLEDVELMRSQIQQEQRDETALDTGARKSNAHALRPTASLLSKMRPEEIEMQKSVVEWLMMKKEAGFMRMLRRMDIPIDVDGYVRYGDCVLAITKEHHGLDAAAARQATKFLGLTRAQDPTTYLDCFKVHHALAVRKIMRLLRQRKQEADLQKRAKALFRPFPSFGQSLNPGDLDRSPDGHSSSSYNSRSDGGNLPAAVPDTASPLHRGNLRAGTSGAESPESSGTHPPGGDSRGASPTHHDFSPQGAGNPNAVGGDDGVTPS